jgi:hypothetical protein
MDVLTIILACSVYPDDHLVRAMVELASQNNQYFVGDLATLLAFDQAKSKADAERVVTEVARHGGRPAIGLMGVPMSWAGRHGKTTPELLDACTNVWVGTTVLAAHEEACARSLSTTATATATASAAATGNTTATATPPGGASRTRRAPPEAVRLCALRRYGADLGFDGYADAALRYLARQRVLFGGPAGPPPGGPMSGVDPPMCRCEPPRPPRPVARRKPPPPAPVEPPRLEDDFPLPRRPTAAAGSTEVPAALNPGLAPILE